MSEVLAATPTLPRLIPYAAAGDLAYGGKLHGLLAGSLYAGTLEAPGTCVSLCTEYKLPTRCRGTSRAELYYVEPQLLHVLDQRLGSLGAERRTIILRHGELVIHAEAHLATGCRIVNNNDNWVRLLLALPPQAPPPATPMAVYTAIIEALEPCQDQQAFCKNPAASTEAAIADILVSTSMLNSWLESLNAQLLPAPARLSPNNLTIYTHVPTRRKEQ